MLARFAGALALIVPATLAQVPFPLTEIADLRDFGATEDDSETANLGFAIATAKGLEKLRLDGRDDARNPWRVWLPTQRFSTVRLKVYQSDLDANGRSDLLFANVVIGNGRCIGHGFLTTLLFDSVGRPVPWRMETQAFPAHDRIAFMVVDLNGDGRAEIVTSACAYAQREEVALAEDRWITGIYEARESRWVALKPALISPYLQALKQRFAKLDPAYLDWIPPPDPISPDPLEGWGERPMTKVTGLLTGEMGCAGSAIGAVDDREPDHGCTPLIGSNRIRFADGTVRNGWPAVVRESPSGREIYLADRRDTLKKVLAAGLSFRPLGPESKPAFLWIHAPSDSPLRPVELRLAARVLRSTEIERAEPPDDVPAKPSGPYIVGPTGVLQTPGAAIFSPPDTGTEPEALGVRVDRFVRIPEDAPERSETPLAEPRNGHFFSRNGRCYFMPRPRSGARTVHLLDGCAQLAPLEFEANSGERVLISSFPGAPRTISPEGKSYRSMHGSSSPGNRVLRETAFAEIPGHPGEVIGTARLEPRWLVQWESGTASWFAVHDKAGKPQSGALEIGFEGELLDGDVYKGLEFLRWADGVPVESSIVHVALEWVPTN